MRRLIVVFTLVFTLLVPATGVASGPRFSECLLPRSAWNIVSLGAPLASERLGNKSSIRYGVIPFKLSDSTSYDLTEGEKLNYLQAASMIEKLSSGAVKVEMVFYPTVDSKMLFQQAAKMVQERNIGWEKWDLNKSTFGILKNVVRNVDPLLDLSNLDGVILENKSRSFGAVAEAFQLFRTPPDLEVLKRGIASGYDFKFHQSIETREGFIDNGILFDTHRGTTTIAHEMLHNFGLTDLYGGVVSTPGALSIMDFGSTNLLNYEKAALGWLSIEQIKCLDLSELETRPLSENKFELNNLDKSSVIIIKFSDTDAHILEVRQESITPALILYKLKQNSRPPIEMMSTSTGIGQSISLTNPNSIGGILKSDQLQVMISNISDKSATLHVIPDSKLNSPELDSLRLEVERNRLAALASLNSKRPSAAGLGVVKSTKKAITCKKGKVKVTVTGKKPKCPSGYKLN